MVLRNERASYAVVAVILIWAAFVWTTTYRVDLATDWNCWRQTDTQTIALNFMKPGSELLKPQISWGGDGPGYVETELQFYTLLVASVMGVAGPVEWAGRLISLLAVLGTTIVLYFHLAGRYSRLAAAAGVLAFIGVRTIPHLASVVMPDALALFLFSVAWAAFYRYFRAGRTLDLAVYAVAGGLAMVVKPTASQIGIASFLFLALADRSKLADRRVWIAWLAMLGAFALYLVHAHAIYDEYGNTFGLLFGEDSKRPKLRHLLMPSLYLGAILNMARWGTGVVGALAAAGLILRRKIEAEHIALSVAGTFLVFVAFRYMSQDSGNYYYAPMTLLGGGLVAAFTDELLRVTSNTTARVGLILVACALLFQVVRGVQIREFTAHYDDPEVRAVAAAGKEVARLTEPDDLIVARSPNEAFDVFWDTGRNYHDPRVFYLSQTRGWTVGSEQGVTPALAQAITRGARFFVDPLPKPNAEIDAWLRREGDLVWSTPEGRIWQFHVAGAPAH